MSAAKSKSYTEVASKDISGETVPEVVTQEEKPESVPEPASEPVKDEPTPEPVPITEPVKEETPMDVLREISAILIEYKHTVSDIPPGHRYFDLVNKHRLLSNP